MFDVAEVRIFPIVLGVEGPPIPRFAMGRWCQGWDTWSLCCG